MAFNASKPPNPLQFVCTTSARKSAASPFGGHALSGQKHSAAVDRPCDRLSLRPITSECRGSPGNGDDGRMGATQKTAGLRSSGANGCCEVLRLEIHVDLRN